MTVTVEETVEDPTFSCAQVCEIVGITYRQLDYWLRNCYVDLSDEARNFTPGSGHRRRLSRGEAEQVYALAKLVRHGFKVDIAADALKRREGDIVTMPGGLQVNVA